MGCEGEEVEEALRAVREEVAGNVEGLEEAVV